MKTTLALLALAFFSSSALGETAVEIAVRFEKQKIEALENYLTENPEADDKDAALTLLVGASMTMGDFVPIPDLLEQRYEMQPKGPDANLQVIMQEIVKPYLDSAIVSDQRDKAKAFVTRVRNDFAADPQIGGILDQWSSELYLPGVGDSMEIAFTAVDGQEIDLEQMRDQVVLVDFWATWCGPCLAEMPHLMESYAKYHDQGFEIVGISLDDNIDTLQKFLSDNQIPWPNYFDGKVWENEIAQRFGINRLPASFLIGKGGKIVASNLRGPELLAAVEKELGSESSPAE